MNGYHRAAMLDLKRILEDLDTVRTAVRNKNEASAVEYIDKLPGLAEARRASVGEGDEIRAKRNALSKEIGQKKRAGEDADALMAESTALAAQLEEFERSQKDADEAIRDALLRIPNLADADVPVGTDESTNADVAHWGDKPALGFKAQVCAAFLKSNFDVPTPHIILDNFLRS